MRAAHHPVPAWREQVGSLLRERILEMINHTDPVIQWLLESGDPSLRYFTLTELLDQPAHSPDVLAAQKRITRGPRVRALLAGQQPDGGFGVHPYQKWTGARRPERDDHAERAACAQSGGAAESVSKEL